MSALVSSRTSPALLVSFCFAMTLDLPFIRFSQTDDPDAARDGREAHHVQPSADVTQGDVATLGIFPAPIFSYQCGRKIELRHHRERQTAHPGVVFAFDGVELDPQTYLLYIHIIV